MNEKTEINIRFGSVTAYFHVAGYTFARGASELRWLLEDKRWKKREMVFVRSMIS
jgi:hypothetical protein